MDNDDERAAQLRELARRPRKPRRMIRHVCEICGNRFTSPRITRRYCSNTCAARAYRARRKADPQDSP
jgi:hypothetical protein